MNISQAAAMNIVPVMARIVLAAAFIPTGWDKIFGGDVQFTGEDARILIQEGVGSPSNPVEVIQKTAFRVAEPVDSSGAEPAPASGGQEQTQPPAEPPATEPAPAATMPATAPATAPVTVPEPAQATPPTVASEPSVDARRLHRITIMLHEANWPWSPPTMAWLAATTELVGGVLILIGFFSRIWGLGLATAMGFAFYLTSWSKILDIGFLNLADSIADFNRTFTQLGLFVLALGVAMTGPGALSLDRMLFRRTPPMVSRIVEEPHPKNRVM